MNPESPSFNNLGFPCGVTPSIGRVSLDSVISFSNGVGNNYDRCAGCELSLPDLLGAPSGSLSRRALDYSLKRTAATIRGIYMPRTAAAA